MLSTKHNGESRALTQSRDLTKMAEENKTAKTCEEETGYWQTVTLTYPDGFSTEVKLDNPTIRRLQAGDNELMQSIRENITLMVQEPTRNDSVSDSVSRVSVDVDPRGPSPEIPSPESSGSGQEKENSYQLWPREAILLLISLYKEHEKMIEDPKTKKRNIWKIITHTMVSKGYNFSQNKVESKWRSLLQSHKDVRINNQSTGKRRKTFQFFEEIEEIVAKRHDIYPKITRGTDVVSETKSKFESRRKSTVTVSDVSSHSSDDDSEVSLNKSTTGTRGLKKRQDDNQGISEFLEFFKECEERKRKEREEKEKNQNERAREKMDIMKSILDVLKSNSK